ncbi:bestrophin family protein [Capilliphycus salinus ALCB114379]|uniref:bestrophin family protein n=1 Tax=Capilliphycus salinus TaxID=2768948 RepID=UPI0039A69E30
MVGDNKNWFQLAFRVSGSVIPAILPRVVFCTLFGVVLSILYDFGLSLPTRILDSFLIPDLVLGLLLVFRTNTAYDRFWEGRKMWGTLVNTVRNFSRQIWVTIRENEPKDTEEKIATLKLLVAFAFATKLHLRGEKINQEIEVLVTPEQYSMLKQMNHPPLEIALWIGDYLQRQHNRNCLNTYQLTAMFKLLDTMVDVLGACERILKTPIPLAYNIHLKQILLIYCLVLSLQLADDLLWYNGIVVGMISFTLFGIEEIGREIENPFGYDPNDLQLDAICQTMQRNIADIICIKPSVHCPENPLNSRLMNSRNSSCD